MAENVTRDFMGRKRHISVSHTASEITALLKHNPIRNTNSISYEHENKIDSFLSPSN